MADAVIGSKKMIYIKNIISFSQSDINTSNGKWRWFGGGWGRKEARDVSFFFCQRCSCNHIILWADCIWTLCWAQEIFRSNFDGLFYTLWLSISFYLTCNFYSLFHLALPNSSAVFADARVLLYDWRTFSYLKSLYIFTWNRLKNQIVFANDRIKTVGPLIITHANSPYM